ncbi:MAG TPA: hypothetical protein DD706_15540 [Nitrospiraceae bacterium]|nr:hypothetical protein [Nitrospiraceae bacterium]
MVRSPSRVRPSNKAELGVNGFGYFCRNKSGSAAGPNPGITKNLVPTIVGQPHSVGVFGLQRFLRKNPGWNPEKNVGNDRIEETF